MPVEDRNVEFRRILEGNLHVHTFRFKNGFVSSNPLKRDITSRGLIQVGVNVTVPGKKKPSASVHGPGPGWPPVPVRCTNVRCVSFEVLKSILLLTTV
jgi:hypothetical protein